ncbi:cell filamentation protein Fic [Methylomonas koyamae]|uniref:Cell filamentation protein Fic n=1 Tax=Methylomonas koyamae TaxID=702114 RepID=A0A177NGQ3_9GAMM|nr:Fic family protein [Methylomonas koyamae]OAI17075.1 cell filamentation protein Fic [Methylomonas koyamae]
MNADASFAEIDRLKSRLDSLRPLPEHTVRTLHEQQVLEWTYHSNAIEGNTLTLKETKVVLEGITIGGKPLREHFEVINHKEAIDYVEAIVQNQEALSEWQIKSIHHLVLKNIDDRNAGQYRQENVVIAGAEHLPPDYLKVPEAMAGLMAWYRQATGLDSSNPNTADSSKKPSPEGEGWVRGNLNNEESFISSPHPNLLPEGEGVLRMHPVECAAQLHVDFVGIHPFVDGNGRTSRLLMNFELMRRGFLPVIIPVEQRLAYYDALDTAHTRGDYSLFIELVASLEQATLERYLRIVQGSFPLPPGEG